MRRNKMFEETQKFIEENITVEEKLKRQKKSKELDLVFLDYHLDKDKYLGFMKTYEGNMLKIIKKIYGVEFPKYQVGKITNVEEFKKEFEKCIQTIKKVLGVDKNTRNAEEKIEEFEKEIPEDKREGLRKYIQGLFEYVDILFGIQRSNMLFDTLEYLNLSELDKYDILCFLNQKRDVRNIKRFLNEYPLDKVYWEHFKKLIFE